MPLGNPQWGQAVAQAFQQGTNSVAGALREKYLRRLEEEERLRQDRRFRAQMRLTTPGATDDPRRQAVKAPEATLPGTQESAGHAGTPAGPVPLEGSQGGIASVVPKIVAPQHQIRGTATATGVAPVQGQLASGVRDLGEEAAAEFGFRYIDEQATPEYKREYADALAQAMSLKPYMQQQDVSGMDLYQLRAAAGGAAGQKEEVGRLRGEAQRAEDVIREQDQWAAAMGVTSEHDLTPYADNPYFDALGHHPTHQLASGVAGQVNRRYQDDQNYRAAQLQMERERLQLAREEAAAANEERRAKAAAARKKAQQGEKGNVKMQLTIKNAEEAHKALSGSGAPSWPSAFGEAAGGILGVGSLDTALRNKWKGQTARTIEAQSAAFTEGFLREMTGAAVAESEWPRYASMFVPVTGDSPFDLAQKEKRRQNLLDAMQTLAGQGYSLEEIQAEMGSAAREMLGDEEEEEETGFSKSNPARRR